MTQGFEHRRDRAQLERLTSAFGPVPAPDILDALARFLELVVTWNKKLDLTAARGTGTLLEVMLADALVLAGSGGLIPEAARCIDVGSGAGAPALPLALLRSDLRLVLVEPLRKRVAFMRTAVGSLGLASRVQVVEQKLDPEAPIVSGEPFDVALSRATFAPEVWLAAGVQLAQRTLVLLASQQPPAAARATLEREVEYALPWSGAARRIVAYARA